METAIGHLLIKCNQTPVGLLHALAPQSRPSFLRSPYYAPALYETPVGVSLIRGVGGPPCPLC